MFGKTGIQLKIRKFKGEFYALYNGWKSISDYNLAGEDNPQYATVAGTPAWYTLNIRCAFAINKHIQLMGALDNILDTNYRVFASGISAPGRNLTLTLRAGF
jgi:hemoglobin/transferrin/lactoferrin receptor protein